MPMSDIRMIQLLVCLALGVAGIALVIVQYLRNRRRGNTQAVKFLVLGLIVVPVLLVPVWLYLGQLWIIVSGGAG